MAIMEEDLVRFEGCGRLVFIRLSTYPGKKDSSTCMQQNSCQSIFGAKLVHRCFQAVGLSKSMAGYYTFTAGHTEQDIIWHVRTNSIIGKPLLFMHPP